MKDLKTQLKSIIATAFCAALIAIIQGLTADIGVCENVILDPTETGILGGALKVVHSTLQITKIIT